LEVSLEAYAQDHAPALKGRKDTETKSNLSLAVATRWRQQWSARI
jgi:hypothetical protein